MTEKTNQVTALHDYDPRIDAFVNNIFEVINNRAAQEQIKYVEIIGALTRVIHKLQREMDGE